MSKMRALPCRVATVSPRVREFVASTEAVAADGGIIRAAGWRFSRYADNPVFLWCHNRSAPPIAKGVAWGIQDGALRVRVEFPEEGVYPFADLIGRLFDGDFLRMVSVSWDTTREGKPTAEEVTRGARWVSDEQELLEVSAVPIGSDPKALKVGRLAEAVAARSLLASDPALIRASMAGVEGWEALAAGIDEAVKARALPPTPPEPAVPPKPAGFGRTIEDLLAALFGVAVGPAKREEVVAAAAARGLDLCMVAEELRAVSIRLADLADTCDEPAAEPPPEFPDGAPSPRGVNSPASRATPPTVASDATGSVAAVRGMVDALIPLARLYAGRP